MTTIGLITLTGLVVSFFYIRAARFETAVQKAWWCVFGPFVATSIAQIGGANITLFYITAALGGAGYAMWTFRKHYALSAIAFIFLFGINIAGTWVHLHEYKLAGIDVLDVAVWSQTALLFRMCIDYPDKLLSRPIKTNTNNVLRVIHGSRRFGTSSEA